MESDHAWLKESISEMKNDMKSGFSEVRRDLTDIKTQVAVLETDMKNMATNQTSEVSERKLIEKRVSDLEAFKWKLTGIMTIGAGVVSVLVSLLLKLFGL